MIHTVYCRACSGYYLYDKALLVHTFAVWYLCDLCETALAVWDLCDLCATALAVWNLCDLCETALAVWDLCDLCETPLAQHITTANT